MGRDLQECMGLEILLSVGWIRTHRFLNYPHGGKPKKILTKEVKCIDYVGHFATQKIMEVWNTRLYEYLYPLNLKFQKN